MCHLLKQVNMKVYQSQTDIHMMEKWSLNVRCHKMTSTSDKVSSTDESWIIIVKICIKSENKNPAADNKLMGTVVNNQVVHADSHHSVTKQPTPWHAGLHGNSTLGIHNHLVTLACLYNPLQGLHFPYKFLNVWE